MDNEKPNYRFIDWSDASTLSATSEATCQERHDLWNEWIVNTLHCGGVADLKLSSVLITK